MTFFKKSIFLSFLALSSIACQNDGIYKSIEDMPDGKWYIKKVPTFSFEIKNETVPYNVYYYIRNAISYPYYNLFITKTLSDPNGKIIFNNKLEELTLFDPTTGKPRGDGLGDIFDHKILILKEFKFPKKGKYTLKLNQYMRQDPLVGIMSVGVSIENMKK